MGKDSAMSNLRMKAEERVEILAYLEALLGCVKSLHASVGAVMADVAEMRNALFDDPEELAMYRTSLKRAVTSAKPVVEEAMRSYEDLMEEITGPQQYKN